ncbi:MAG: dephospho-CoA kinase [Magnetococcales bacterium]|nr:dephospho-CoA kinase [Magnetococcales bacterium]
MVLIGVTGGIGCGKSTVAALLARKGAWVLDADLCAREALQPRWCGLRAIVEVFGASVLREDGSLDRRRLGELATASLETLLQLESILHPLIFRIMAVRLAERYHLDSETVAVLDVPLLFESGLDVRLDTTVNVFCGAAWHERVLSRGDAMPERVRHLLRQRQLPEAEKRCRCTHLLDNQGGLQELESQVDVLWRTLQGLRGSVWPEAWERYLTP